MCLEVIQGLKKKNSVFIRSKVTLTFAVGNSKGFLYEVEVNYSIFIEESRIHIFHMGFVRQLSKVNNLSLNIFESFILKSFFVIKLFNF